MVQFLKFTFDKKKKKRYRKSLKDFSPNLFGEKPYSLSGEFVCPYNGKSIFGIFVLMGV